MREIYLDNSATTRCFPETAELMNKLYLEEYGNPSSMHHKGVEAERRLTEASAILAGILKVRPANLIYTSCGTESDNHAAQRTPSDYDSDRTSGGPGDHAVSGGAGI